MKFLISFVALAFVAVSVDATWPADATTLAKIEGVQNSVKTIGLAATDLDTMEGLLTPLTEEANIAKVTAATTVLTTAVDKRDLNGAWNTAPPS